MNGYDLDGVITAGLVPTSDDVVITGRSFEEAPETYKMLRDMGIFNAVYFNPVPFGGKTLENSGDWKAQMAKQLNVAKFFEDDIRQMEIIKNNNPKIDVVLVTDKFIKDSQVRY
jgi:hypothetical protein